MPLNKNASLSYFFFLFLSLFSLTLSASENGSAKFSSAVASAHPLATEAGLHILKQGGNAFDAAIAVTAALAVVEPYSSGIGGGGFWLIHEADSQRDRMIDGREKAPGRASRNMYLDKQGNVIEGASITGPLAAGIPGVPAALDYLATHYGKLSLSRSLAPAIALARNGFEVDNYYRRMARFRLEDLLGNEAASKIFLQQGAVPETGYRIVQPDLANTLERIATQGKDGFYQGQTAWKLIKDVRRHGGIWTMKDLATYEVIERDPDIAYYKGLKLVTATLPSSGGLTLSEMLNILSRFDLESMPRARRIHLVVEAMRRAYRDRAEYMGDTDFVDVPADFLVSEKNTLDMVKSINLNRASPETDDRKLSAPTGAGTDTTHFSILDSAGNRVSATLSINYPFGSCFVAEGTGVLLNDEMDDFSAKPGVPNVYGLIGNEANAIEPGKRMLSSMSPSFAETRDRLAIIGTPGGSRIITMVLNAVLDFYQGGDAEHIVNLGRFHHQYLPDVIYYEPGVFEPDIVRELENMGHKLKQLDSSFGNMQVVVINKRSGKVEAASDPRGIGSASVLDREISE